MGMEATLACPQGRRDSDRIRREPHCLREEIADNRRDIEILSNGRAGCAATTNLFQKQAHSRQMPHPGETPVGFVRLLSG